MAIVNGFGRGEWGQLTWGEPIPVVVTGVAGTSALGSESVVAEANVAVTGIAGTTALGNETVQANADVGVTNNLATTAL